MWDVLYQCPCLQNLEHAWYGKVNLVQGGRYVGGLVPIVHIIQNLSMQYAYYQEKECASTARCSWLEVMDAGAESPFVWLAACLPLSLCSIYRSILEHARINDRLWSICYAEAREVMKMRRDFGTRRIRAEDRYVLIGF